MLRIVASFAFSLVLARANADESISQKDFNSNCAPCHSLQDGEHFFGPSLFRVYGRLAGTAKDFGYSESYLQAGTQGLRWDRKTLDKFLDDPAAFLASTVGSVSNQMPTRYPDENLRASIIEYLEGLSQ